MTHIESDTDPAGLKSDPAKTCVTQLISQSTLWKRATLAGAATSPRPAAAAATAATTAAAPTAAAAAAATATAATAAPGGLLTKLGRCGVLLVEHIEGRQADVGNLLLAEEELMLCGGVLRRNIRRRSTSSCRRPTGHSKRHAGDSQNGDGLAPTASLCRLLRARHLKSSHTCGYVAQVMNCASSFYAWHAQPSKRRQG
jgi:hypothetical protein